MRNPTNNSQGEIRIPCPICGANPSRSVFEIIQGIVSGNLAQVEFDCHICGRHTAVWMSPEIELQLMILGFYGPDCLQKRGLDLVHTPYIAWCPAGNNNPEHLEIMLPREHS